MHLPLRVAWRGTAQRRGGARYSRHDNHAEVQPVPRVPKKGERMQAEAPGQYLDQRLKGVNGSEGVPGRRDGSLREAKPVARLPGSPGGVSPAQPPLRAPRLGWRSGLNFVATLQLTIHLPLCFLTQSACHVPPVPPSPLGCLDVRGPSTDLLTPALGVRGHRPMVATGSAPWDSKDTQVTAPHLICGSSAASEERA